MTITALALIFGLLAGSIYAVWKSHEEAKAAEREKFRSGFTGPRLHRARKAGTGAERRQRDV